MKNKYLRVLTTVLFATLAFHLVYMNHMQKHEKICKKRVMDVAINLIK